MRVKFERLAIGVDFRQNLSPVLADQLELPAPPRRTTPRLRRSRRANGAPAIAQFYATIQNLRRTRDLLLPRLLSGQIDVEAARAMSPHAYTEDQLVEQPAIGLFAELGWQTVSAMEETFGAGRHARPRDEGRGGVGVPAARGARAAEPRAAARGHHRRRGRIDPRPLGHEPGGGKPRGLSAAQGRHQGLGAGP